MRYKVRTNYEDKRVNDALLQLESALALDAPPMRIECFDISTIHGSYTVASMVVFTGGKPDKNQYRRFKIKTPLDEANDFLSMQEVMSRRYCAGAHGRRALRQQARPHYPRRRQAAAVGGDGDVRRDGNRRHRACAVLAKRDEELFVPWQDTGPVVLPSGSASLYLVKQVRDEAHRFAITFHRELRGKGMTASILDEVAGLGPCARKPCLSISNPSRTSRQRAWRRSRRPMWCPTRSPRSCHKVIEQYNSERKDELVVGGE